MSLQSVSPQMVNAGTNRFLSRFIPMLGVSLSEMDMLRGWKDDFLGDAIADQYDVTDVVGVGSGINLWDGLHGGQVRLGTGAAAGRYAALWLGSPAGANDSLCANPGFVMIARYCLNATTDIITDFGVWNAAANRRITIRANTAAGGNWYLICQDNLGTTTTDTGIATDTSYHWHVIDGQSTEINYFLDGVLIGTGTANIPTDVLTPIVRCSSNGAAVRHLYLDYWAVIPR